MAKRLITSSHKNTKQLTSNGKETDHYNLVTQKYSKLHYRNYGLFTKPQIQLKMGGEPKVKNIYIKTVTSKGSVTISKSTK